MSTATFQHKSQGDNETSESLSVHSSVINGNQLTAVANSQRKRGKAKKNRLIPPSQRHLRVDDILKANDDGRTEYNKK